MPLATVCASPQLEPVMSIPKVQQISYKDHLYLFNGWVGEHDVTRRTLFEFENSEARKTIWVDINGSFVCEK